jgi:hypothetical protein
MQITLRSGSSAVGLSCAALLACAWLTSACGGAQVRPSHTAETALPLVRVVLYRNGVGYFERHGLVHGNELRLKVRKDQINDLLKSLAVVDRKSGKVLGISIPLDPQSWHKLALGALTPGQGRLAQVLDGLRGSYVTVETRSRDVSGRIVMVERMEPIGDGGPRPNDRPEHDEAAFEDHKLTLLDGERMQVVRLSQIESIALEDGDLVMQLDRHLDASAGEGMFQQVELTIRLEGDGEHDLALSYVAPAPLWKPTYRVVLDDESGKALLQAWAVVDNTSGESWNDVQLSLTSGAPIAFRYDLHTPREVERPDLSHSAADKRAAVAIGERSYSSEEPPSAAAPPADAAATVGQSARGEGAVADEDMAQAEKSEARRASGKKAKRDGAYDRELAEEAAANPVAPPAPMPAPAMTMDALRTSAAPQARAKRVAGQTRFDLTSRVTLPDGSATMVSLVNQAVKGEQVFVYRPGGSGQGYELNPYRVVRFQNETEFVLEPGPIAIYAGGSFVGEGLSEAIGSRELATIPFAVEPALAVRERLERDGTEVRTVKLARGVLEVESFHRVTTVWTVTAASSSNAQRVLIRHPRRGGNYELVEPRSGVEKLADAYFVPVVLPVQAREASVSVVEQTPVNTTVSLWDSQAVELLDTLLSTSGLDAATRAKLEPVVQKRREIGRIDTEIEGLHAQKNELDQRVMETRESLRAIQRDPRAGALRKRLGERLDEFLREADAAGRKVVELQSRRLELKIELEDLLQAL